MHDWQEAERIVTRYAMPVSSDNRRKAASKKTYRSKLAGKKVAKVIGGKHKRRLRRMD